MTKIKVNDVLGVGYSCATSQRFVFLKNEQAKACSEYPLIFCSLTEASKIDEYLKNRRKNEYQELLRRLGSETVDYNNRKYQLLIYNIKQEYEKVDEDKFFEVDESWIESEHPSRWRDIVNGIPGEWH